MDIVLKNKDPKFRQKVSAGLKRRKQLLGENYHSAETKRKIGTATIEHWESYDDATREHMLDVLRQNGAAKRKYGPYDVDWPAISKAMRENGVCHRCGAKEHLIVYHIIPVKAGGTRELKNLVVLCNGCHTTVENMQKQIYEIIPDWNIIQLLVRERLHCL